MAISPDARQQRNALRQMLRARRRALPPWKQRLAARHLARRVARHPLLRHARPIAAYLAQDGEMSPAPLLHRILRQSPLFLPTSRCGRRHFVRSCRLQGAAGPSRPSRRAGNANPPGRSLQPRRLGLVLIPVVGFDGRGGRLGQGGGFYDRCFAFRRHSGRRPILLGLAHALQEAEEVPLAAWDVPLDAIATERGLRRFRHGTAAAQLRRKKSA